MTTDTSMPMRPGGASDLPGQAAPTWTPAHVHNPTSIVEPIPDARAARALALMAIGGLVAQLLFFRQAPGINVVLWISFVLSAALATRRPASKIDRFDLWLPASALMFAAFCAWRTDGMLLAFNLLASGSLTLASVVALGGRPLTRSTGRVVARYGAIASGMFVVGAVYLGGGVRALRPIAGNSQSTGRRIVRGLVPALPLVLLFAALFGAADAVFGALLHNLVRVDLDTTELFGRTFLTVAAAWLLGGTLVNTWLRPAVDEAKSGSSAAEVGSNPRIGSVEAIVILLSINAVFAVFVALQAAYLFGGLDTLALSGMTYSEYARRGFGELVVAAWFAGIVLVVIGANSARPGRWQRILSAALCVGIGVIVLSAFQRITLYQEAYGWTELRFYTVAAITWLAACAGAALVAVARDRIRVLPAFALAAGLVVAVLCNLIGPQSFVTEQNVRRALDPALVPPGGKSGLDVGYLYSLDADAIRVLVGSVGSLPPGVQGEVIGYLRFARDELLNEKSVGWPSWNYARAAAVDALVNAGY